MAFEEELETERMYGKRVGFAKGFVEAYSQAYAQTQSMVLSQNDAESHASEYAQLLEQGRVEAASWLVQKRDYTVADVAEYKGVAKDLIEETVTRS